MTASDCTAALAALLLVAMVCLLLSSAADTPILPNISATAIATGGSNYASPSAVFGARAAGFDSTRRITLTSSSSAQLSGDRGL